MTDETKVILAERRDQLRKDIDNYEHMLEEAGDLEKAWNKSDSEMASIKLDGNFFEVATIFEHTVDLSVESEAPSHCTFKDVKDRVAFDKLVSLLDTTECLQCLNWARRILMIWLTPAHILRSCRNNPKP